MKKAILITPEDEVKVIDYEDGLTFLQAQVGGHIKTLVDEVIPGSHIASNSNEDTRVVGYCNEEGLLIDTCCNNKVNALMSVLNDGNPIYGNVVLVKGVGEDTDGFDYKEVTRNGITEMDVCECWAIHDLYTSIRNKITKESLGIYHSIFDGKKPEPTINFVSFSDFMKEEK